MKLWQNSVWGSNGGQEWKNTHIFVILVLFLFAKINKIFVRVLVSFSNMNKFANMFSNNLRVLWSLMAAVIWVSLPRMSRLHQIIKENILMKQSSFFGDDFWTSIFQKNWGSIIWWLYLYKVGGIYGLYICVPLEKSMDRSEIWYLETALNIAIHVLIKIQG